MVIWGSGCGCVLILVCASREWCNGVLDSGSAFSLVLQNTAAVTKVLAYAWRNSKPRSSSKHQQRSDTVNNFPSSGCLRFYGVSCRAPRRLAMGTRLRKAQSRLQLGMHAHHTTDGSGQPTRLVGATCVAGLSADDSLTSLELHFRKLTGIGIRFLDADCWPLEG